MGEPLAYKDRQGRTFDDIIALCREFGVKLNLTTNGSFPGRAVRDWARLIIPVASDVKISWNGASAATQHGIMRHSDFDVQVLFVGALTELWLLDSWRISKNFYGSATSLQATALIVARLPCR